MGEAVVAIDDIAIERRDIDARQVPLEELPIALFRFPQGLFRLPAITDVAKTGDDAGNIAAFAVAIADGFKGSIGAIAMAKTKFYRMLRARIANCPIECRQRNFKVIWMYKVKAVSTNHFLGVVAEDA